MGGGPLAMDPWERGFDAGWLAAMDERRRRLWSRFRLSGPDGYWSRLAGGLPDRILVRSAGSPPMRRRRSLLRPVGS